MMLEEEILAAPVLLGAAGGAFALFLAFADRLMEVREDPRVELVEKALPGLNCGACGFSSCASYARAIVEGTAAVGRCPSADKESVKFLKSMFLSSEESPEKKVAVVRCAGGSAVKFAYRGPASCEAAQLVAGGFLECPRGCLGFGDCVKACPQGAIKIGEAGIAEINHSKCTGCGLCVKACPRDIIELIPASRKYYVACSSPDKAEVRNYCKNGCFACGICASQKFNPEGVVEMKGNLPVVIEDKLRDSSQLFLAGSRCPVKAWKEITF